MSGCKQILNEQVKSLRAKNEVLHTANCQQLCDIADLKMEAIEANDIIADLTNKLQRYDQAPRTPFIKGGTCNTTHSACDCVIKRTAELEAAYKHAIEGLEQVKAGFESQGFESTIEEINKHIAECEQIIN